MSRDSYENWGGPRTRRRNSGGHGRDDFGGADDSWADEQDPYGQGRSPYGQDSYGGAEGYPQDDPYGGSYARSGPYSQPDPYGQQDPYGQADPYGQQDPYGQADPGSGPYDSRYGGQGYPGEDAADPYQSGGYAAPGGYDQYSDGDYSGGGGYDTAGDRYSNGSAGQRGYADSGGYSYPGQRYSQEADPAIGRAARRSRAQQETPAAARPRGRSGRRGDPFDDRHSEFFSGFSDDDEPRRRRFPVGLIALFIIMAVLGGVAGVGYHYYSLYKTRHASFAGPGFGKVDIIVPKGATGDTIAPELVSKGVVGSVDSFAAYVANKTGLHPGEYQLRRQMSNAEAWAVLTNLKDQVNSTVTIVDGLPSFEYLPKLAKATGIPLKQFQAAFKDGSKLGLPSYAKGDAEGYVFPDTYDIVPGSTSALAILKQAVQQFKNEAVELHLAADAKKDGFSEAQVITEASLLEAEVPPKYFGKVATVIDNRLNGLDGITPDLQLDSTEAFVTHKFIFNLTKSDLNVSSPYNTFHHPGLPPGPINSPDAAAITAALHPTPGPWTYFVTVNKKGLTMFTSSFSQFTTWSAEAKKNGV